MRTSPFSMLAADTIEKQIEFARLPEGWAAIGLIVLLGGLLFAAVQLYRREQRAGASRRVRVALAAIRCSVLVLLAVIWLEPVLATYIHRRIESVTLLLFDGSASMGMKDLYPDEADRERVAAALSGSERSDPAALSRGEMAGALLSQGGGSLLRQLAEDNAVQVYQFGDRLYGLGRIAQMDSESQGGGEANADPPASQPADHRGDGADAARAITAGQLQRLLADPQAPATDVSDAIRQAVESHGNKPVAAIVVFSDGQFNQGEPVEVVARYARSKKIPIHAVGVGDPSPARNVTVAALEAPANVFVKDPFQVTLRLRTSGLAGATLDVELLEQRDEGQTPTTVASRRVTVSETGSTEPVVFTHRIPAAAQARLLARVSGQPGETLLDDNQKEISVRALENKMRVLLIAGGPSWDYRYLTRFLERDATMNVSCWLQSADPEAVRDGNTVIDHFPREREELFIYDCIVLLDPDPRDFDPTWTDHVEEMIGSTGAGLLYIAGRKFTPSRFAHDPDTQSLLSLLPVVINPNEAELLVNEQGHYQQTAWPLVVPAEAAGHPVLAMSDQPGENAQIWSRLPGVYWHYPVNRAKPVATVLLRHSNPRMRNAHGGHVLLASQFFGSGRTGFLGFQGTWRWRRYGDRYFNRFWIQLLRHLVEGKLLSGQKRGLIQTERETYAVGEPVWVEARLLDTRNLPFKRDQVEAGVTIDGRAGPTVTLEPQTDRPGWYRGRFVATEIGDHVLQIELPGGGGVPPATIRGQLRVGRPDLEFRETRLDRRNLATLATQSAGGAYLDIDEIDRLAELIPSRTATIVLSDQPEPLWDRWWVFVLLIGLLGAEWAGRKRARML